MSKRAVIRIFFCLILVGTMGFEYFHIKQAVNNIGALYEEKEQLVKEATQAKKDYDLYKKELQKKVYEESKEEPESENYQELLSHESDYEAANQIVNNTFSTLFTWNNSKEYHERADLLVGTLSYDLRRDKTIFSEGKDSVGGDYIKTSELKSKFIKSKVYIPTSKEGNLLEIKAEVTYRSWYGDDSNKKPAVHYYDMVLDQESDQIVSLKRLF